MGTLARLYAACRARVPNLRLNQQLSNLHRVGGSAFAQVVTHAPERQTILAAQILANATDENVIFVIARIGHRIQTSIQIIHYGDTRRRFEQLPGTLDADRRFGFLMLVSPKIFCVS